MIKCFRGIKANGLFKGCQCFLVAIKSIEGAASTMMETGIVGIKAKSLLVGSQRLLIALAPIEGIPRVEPLFFRLLKHARSPYLSLMSPVILSASEGSFLADLSLTSHSIAEPVILSESPVILSASEGSFLAEPSLTRHSIAEPVILSASEGSFLAEPSLTRHSICQGTFNSLHLREESQRVRRLLTMLITMIMRTATINNVSHTEELDVLELP